MKGVTLKRTKSNIRQSQQGFASIVIAIVLVTVLALITIGFAQLSRREQQAALDKTLTNQAYYAAESGINDVYDYLEGLEAASKPLPSPSTQCLPGSTLQSWGLNQQIGNSDSGVSYTCVMLPQVNANWLEVDVTGQARNSLKRLRATMPLTPPSAQVPFVTLTSLPPIL